MLEDHLPPDPINEFQVFDSESSNSEDEQPAGSPGNHKRSAEAWPRRQQSQSEEMEDPAGSLEAPRSSRMNTSTQHLLVSNPNLSENLDSAVKAKRRSITGADRPQAAAVEAAQHQLAWPDSPRNCVALSVAQR